MLKIKEKLRVAKLLSDEDRFNCALDRQHNVAPRVDLLNSLIFMLGVNKYAALPRIYLADDNKQDQIILEAQNARKLIVRNISNRNKVQYFFDNLLVDVFNKTNEIFERDCISGLRQNDTVKNLLYRCDLQLVQLVGLRDDGADISANLSELLTTYRELQATLAILLERNSVPTYI